MKQQSLFGNFDSDPKAPQSPGKYQYVYYAVIENEKKFKRKPAVWGIGKTRNQAIADAVRECADSKLIEIDDEIDMEEAILNTEMLVVPCTKRFFKEVEGYGGGDIDIELTPLGARLKGGVCV